MDKIEWIRDIIYILPLVALIWKLASIVAEVKQLKVDVDRNIAKFCTEHKELEQSVNHNKVIVDEVIGANNDKLTAIQVSIAHIEERSEKQ